MHSLTVRHIESPHRPHRADRSLISLDKRMLRGKCPGRRHQSYSCKLGVDLHFSGIAFIILFWLMQALTDQCPALL